MAHTVVVDVMMILERDGMVLLAERAGTGYADGWYNLPSGKLEPDEDVVAAVIRETREEIGLDLHRDQVRAVHVMHHRNPEGGTRVGWFFTAGQWDAEPYNAEPHKCAGLMWAPLDRLPDNTWPYTAAGLRQYRNRTPFSLHGFDQVCAGSDRTHLPAVDGRPTPGPAESSPSATSEIRRHSRCSVAGAPWTPDRPSSAPPTSAEPTPTDSPSPNPTTPPTSRSEG